MEQPTGRHEHADEARAREEPPRAPRWVKVSGVVVGMLILLIAVLVLTGVGGGHGPGRHFSGSGVPTVAVDATQEPAGPGARAALAASEGR